jgi:hypothetical protein
MDEVIGVRVIPTESERFSHWAIRQHAPTGTNSVGPGLNTDITVLCSARRYSSNLSPLVAFD